MCVCKYPEDTTNPKDLIGIKKPALWLIPGAGLIHTAKAFEDGAKKYEPYNWRDKDVRATVYIAAALRHLHSYLDGEDVASDSGVHHLGHAAACMYILLDASATGNLIDDRPKQGPFSELVRKFTEA
jgi:hypothetical protein